jgi:putative transposase
MNHRSGGEKMQDYRLTIGMRFKRQGREFVIEDRFDNGDFRIRDTVSDACFRQSSEELVEDLFAKKLELIGEDGRRLALDKKLEKSRVTDLSQLSDDDPMRQEIIRRYHYVKDILQAQPLSRTKENLTSLILKTSQRINDLNQPSWVTVNRWFRTFELAGQDIRALAPAHKSRGNHRPKLTGKILDNFAEEDYEKARTVYGIVEQVIRNKYLTKERPSVQSCYDTIKGKIYEENRFRDACDRLPIFHISSLHKIIKKLDPYEVDYARFGKPYADANHRAKKQGPRPTRPLERVEFDHLKINMMVIDPQTRLPLGRPLFTAIIDVFTKMIVGIYLSFHGEGAITVMQCLAHAIKPKTYLKSKYPQIEHDWPVYGVPELIVVDNGVGFHNRHFEDACLQLGIGIQYSFIKRPWLRGTIERWFGTLNRRLLQELPGTTFADIFEKEDYDPEKHAVISLDALLEIIHVWIVDVYHQRFHRGIQDIPYRRWTEAIVEWPPNLPSRASELEVLVGFTEHRRVGPSGVELFTLLYNTDELGLMRRSLKKGERVLVKFDPTDISLIYVWDKVNSKFIVVPALNQAYTQGLTLWQHNVIRKYAQRFIKEKVDDEALCRARERIQEIVSRERLIKRRIGSRQRLARFVNISQPNYSEHAGNNISQLAGQASYDDGLIRLLPGGTGMKGVSDIATSILVDEAGKVLMTKTAEPSGVGVDNSTSDVALSLPEAGWDSDYNLPT